MAELAKSRAAAGVGGAGGAGLTWVLDHVISNPPSWLLWSVGLASIAALIYAFFGPILARALSAGGEIGAAKQTSTGDQSPNIDLTNSKVAGNVTVRVEKSESVLPTVGFDAANNVIVNKIEHGTIFQIFPTRPLQDYGRAALDFSPKEMVDTGDRHSLTASVNVSAVSSTTVADVTEITVAYATPLDGTSWDIAITGENTNFTVKDIDKESIRLEFGKELPNRLGIRIKPSVKDDKN